MRRFVFLIAIAMPWTTGVTAQTPSQLVEVLPPVEGMRLTAFQAQLTGRTQRALHRLNPAHITEVEQLLTKYNMCFREIARLEVDAAYLRIATALTDSERGEVAEHMRSPGASEMVKFEEGSVSRMVVAPGDPALAVPPRSVDRFHRLIGQHVRTITLSLSGPACQANMEADFKRHGLKFLPDRPSERRPLGEER